MAFQVRPCRPEDVPSIITWTTDTFSWGDYVPERLPGWLEDDDSEVLVCADPSERVLALTHVEMLSPREGWLEAARVHPDHRRSGLGKALNYAGVEWARERGAEVMRLATEADNEPAIKQVLGLDYRQTSAWLFADWYADEVGRSDEPSLHEAVGQDADAAWIYWSGTDIYRTGRGLISHGWKWRKARPDDVQHAAERGALYQSQAGWVIVEGVPTEDGPGYLRLDWLATTSPGAPTIVEGLMDLAARKGQGLNMKIPDLPWTREVLTRAGSGYKEILVFAKPTRARIM
ncbi:MAG: GNAT family N-acetyltransferase [Acidimicrobiia bacterium]|nr:GNAT family N-acetyltransferase [Acidimicrobiia bacterium]